MRKIIENLKQKPEHVRRQILLASSLAITGIIFGSWMFLFQSEFSKRDKKPSIASDLKPLSMLKDDFLKTFQTVSDGIGSVKNGIKTTASGTGSDSTPSTSSEQESSPQADPETASNPQTNTDAATDENMTPSAETNN